MSRRISSRSRASRLASSPETPPISCICTQAVESDPAEQARMRVVLALFPRLPDPVVWLSPMAADVIAEAPEHLLGLAIELLLPLRKMRHRFHDFAIDVEL